MGRVAAKKPLLSAANVVSRVQWGRDHRDWTDEDWKRVLWSDESTFQLFSNQRVFVRRRVGERFRKECLSPTVKFGGGKIMVWGCFSSNGVGSLIRVEHIL